MWTNQVDFRKQGSIKDKRLIILVNVNFIEY